MGQCGRSLTAPLQLEWISSASWCLIINTVNQSSVERPVEDTELKWETGWRRSTCYRTYQGDFLWELLPFQPLLSTGAGKPRAKISKESRLLQHLCQPENHSHLSKWVKDLVRGLVIPSGEVKPTAHFIYYIICDCVQFADTLMMVSMYGIFGIWLSQDGMK